MTIQPYLVVQMLILLTLANGTPVIAKRLLGDRLSWPLDGGIRFFDGLPVFGASKTLRGIGASVAVAAALAPLIGLSPGIGATAAASAMLGDLFSSFVKRRMNRPPSSQALGLDQVPESLLPSLVCRKALDLTAADIVVVVVIFFVGELLISRLLYKLHIRDRPY